MNTRQARVVDLVLTNIALGYTHPDRIGHVLFPVVEVLQRGGQVIEFGRESFLRYATRRAPGANTKRLRFGYQGRTFSLVQDALEGMVPREHLEDALEVPGIDLGVTAVNEIMDILSLSLEVEQAKIATDAANYKDSNKVTLSGTDQWSDPASDPALQIRECGDTIRGRIGARPNVLVLSSDGFNVLAEHPKIIERFKYTSSASVTTEMLARLFNVRRVAVGEAVYMNEGDEQVQDVWGNDAVLAYVPERISSARAPSYGYTYTLRGHPMVQEPYFERNVNSFIYPVSCERIPVMTGMDAGFLIQNPVAAS
ncbi:MAG TPA: major capsid protein [Eoetvoesiella sp.]|uniref:major capsid protein n=1 Tax=Alcaligenes aquatilis TaxID=323284 RepID=UPI002FBC8396